MKADGTCSYVTMAQTAIAAGASLLIVVDYITPDRLVAMSGTLTTTLCAINIASSLGASLLVAYSGRTISYPKSFEQQPVDQLAYFSSRGPTDDGRIAPHILAPGYSITSANSDNDLTTNQCSAATMPTPDTDTSTLLVLQGTSQATPLAAAAAILLRQYFTSGYYQHPSPYAETPALSIANRTPSAALLKAVYMLLVPISSTISVTVVATTKQLLRRIALQTSSTI
jgi:hypothetical protein